MSVDLKKLGIKITNYRQLFSVSIKEFAEKTGINIERIEEIEKGIIEPTGDEVLIIADFFRCDFNFFISNQQTSVFEQTDKLFRKFGNELSKNDKWAIQEILYIAECEHYLDQELVINHSKFEFIPTGTFYKSHGAKAAESLRRHFKYNVNQLSLNIYMDFREIGIKIYRKKLENSKISGIYINHPTAGDCIIVNFTEDVFRQRFTAAHEAGHAIFDKKDDINISFSKWDQKDLKEIRANTFASNYLCPEEFINNIPDNNNWTKEKLIVWSKKILVNPKTLLIALKTNNKLKPGQYREFEKTWINKEDKIDPELAQYANSKSFSRISHILECGLSIIYLNKCFRAYENGIISFNRMMEMLFLQHNELLNIFKIFNKRVLPNE